jgi:hypothetical protein
VMQLAVMTLVRDSQMHAGFVHTSMDTR